MEISAEKTKLMTNNTSGINTENKVNGQKLETDTSFKYLGSVITDAGSKPKIFSKTAQTTAALTKLKRVWNDRGISLFQDTTDALPCHVHLPVCYCIMDPHSRSSQKIEVMKMTCYRKILRISQTPRYQRRSLCQDPAGNQNTQRPPDHCKETRTAVV